MKQTMKRDRVFWSALVVTTWLFLGSALAMGVDDEEPMFLVGKKGTVTLGTETKIGALMLAPGNYEFQHRVVDSEHFVRFTRVARSDWSGPKQVAAEVKCRLEPRKTKASQTAIYSSDESGNRRITRVEVKGEDAVHWFSEP